MINHYSALVYIQKGLIKIISVHFEKINKFEFGQHFEPDLAPTQSSLLTLRILDQRRLYFRSNLYYRYYQKHTTVTLPSPVRPGCRHTSIV